MRIKRDDIHYKIKEYRLKKGLSVKELSALSNVSESVIRRVEKNAENLRMPTLIKLSIGLDVPWTDLFECIVDGEKIELE